MRYYISLLLFFFIGANYGTAQTTVKMSAVKANNYGVAYSLPKTSLVITVGYTKKTRKAGEFFQYAERYLSISNPITEDAVSYTLDKIDATTKGVVDKDKSYLVEFRSNTTAPFVTLTKDGLICAINDDYTFPKEETKGDAPAVSATLPVESSPVCRHCHQAAYYRHPRSEYCYGFRATGKFVWLSVLPALL